MKNVAPAYGLLLKNLRQNIRLKMEFFRTPKFMAMIFLAMTWILNIGYCQTLGNPCTYGLRQCAQSEHCSRGLCRNAHCASESECTSQEICLMGRCYQCVSCQKHRKSPTTNSSQHGLHQANNHITSDLVSQKPTSILGPDIWTNKVANRLKVLSEPAMGPDWKVNHPSPQPLNSGQWNYSNQSHWRNPNQLRNPMIGSAPRSAPSPPSHNPHWTIKNPLTKPIKSISNKNLAGSPPNYINVNYTNTSRIGTRWSKWSNQGQNPVPSNINQINWTNLPKVPPTYGSGTNNQWPRARGVGPGGSAQGPSVQSPVKPNPIDTNFVDSSWRPQKPGVGQATMISQIRPLQFSFIDLRDIFSQYLPTENAPGFLPSRGSNFGFRGGTPSPLRSFNFQPGQPLDVVFVVGSSDSIKQNNFNLMKNFVHRTADNMNLNNGLTQIATLFYSGRYVNGMVQGNDCHFTHSPDQLSRSLKAVPYLGGLSATGDALRLVNNTLLQRSSGMRPNSQRAVILLTDGETNDGIHPNIPAASLRDQGVQIYVVGIMCSYSMLPAWFRLGAPMTQITGQRENVFKSFDFKSLNDQLIYQLLTTLVRNSLLRGPTKVFPEYGIPFRTAGIGVNEVTKPVSTPIQKATSAGSDPSAAAPLTAMVLASASITPSTQNIPSDSDISSPLQVPTAESAAEIGTTSVTDSSSIQVPTSGSTAGTVPSATVPVPLTTISPIVSVTPLTQKSVTGTTFAVPIETPRITVENTNTSTSGSTAETVSGTLPNTPVLLTTMSPTQLIQKLPIGTTSPVLVETAEIMVENGNTSTVVGAPASSTQSLPTDTISAVQIATGSVATTSAISTSRTLSTPSLPIGTSLAQNINGSVAPGPTESETVPITATATSAITRSTSKALPTLSLAIGTSLMQIINGSVATGPTDSETVPSTADLGPAKSPLKPSPGSAEQNLTDTNSSTSVPTSPINIGSQFTGVIMTFVEDNQTSNETTIPLELTEPPLISNASTEGQDLLGNATAIMDSMLGMNTTSDLVNMTMVNSTTVNTTEIAFGQDVTSVTELVDGNIGVGDNDTSGINQSERCPKNETKIDIAFVVDHSSSIGARNFKTMTNFLVKVTDAFNVDSGQVQLAIVPYSTRVAGITHLKKHSTNEGIKQEFSGARYRRGKTATGQALIETESKVFQKRNGDRDDAINVAVVFTDGVTTVGPKPAGPGKKLVDAGITVIAVGIKGAPEEELLDITGTRDPGKIFIIEEFEDLEEQQQKLTQQIANAVCEAAEKQK